MAYTIEQFGAKIKEKYPQYGKYSDRQVGELTLEQYPQYRDKVEPVATTEEIDAAPIVGVDAEQPDNRSYFQRVTDKVGTDIDKRVDRYGEIDARQDTNIAEKSIQKFGQGAGMAANALETVVTEIPGVKQAFKKVGEGINWLATSEYSPIKHLGDLIGESETLQEVVKLYDTDKNFKDTVDGVANIARLGGDIEAAVSGVNYAKNVTSKIIDNVKSMKPPAGPGGGGGTADIIKGHFQESGDVLKSLPTEQLNSMGGIKELIKRTQTNIADGLDGSGFKSEAARIRAIDTSAFNTLDDFQKAINPNGGAAPVAPIPKTPKSPGVIDDIIPTTDRIVNHEITRALDLTQGDVKNISLSTGNEVGEFVAKNNLIGKNLAETTKNIDDFYKKNYEQVRAEIAKVVDPYEASAVPRYTEALTEIQKQIKDVAGLQAANTEVATLLGKKTPTLADVQRVKELMDEHFSLYKATGDVKEGVAKEGLTNIRADLRKFIEDEVKAKTGADIQSLNNNVSTSRSINDAIETRATRGLTRSNISAGDIAVFLTGSAFGGGNPLAGLAAVVVKKIYNSPSFKLRLSKWLDGMSDARKAAIKADLEKGIVPEELKDL
jgi:hypothetical protein